MTLSSFQYSNGYIIYRGNIGVPIRPTRPDSNFVYNKCGCFGSGRTTTSFESMETTSDIVGLSVACSCTHSKPTLTHFKSWSWEHDKPHDASTS